MTAAELLAPQSARDAMRPPHASTAVWLVAVTKTDSEVSLVDPYVPVSEYDDGLLVSVQLADPQIVPPVLFTTAPPAGNVPPNTEMF